jgi:hypothetical protein
MCFYHAYTHRCGHTQMVLQQFCAKGQMRQQKCARGQDGTILATVKVETSCSACGKVNRTAADGRNDADVDLSNRKIGGYALGIMTALGVLDV